MPQHQVVTRSSRCKRLVGQEEIVVTWNGWPQRRLPTVLLRPRLRCRIGSSCRALLPASYRKQCPQPEEEDARAPVQFIKRYTTEAVTACSVCCLPRRQRPGIVCQRLRFLDERLLGQGPRLRLPQVSVPLHRCNLPDLLTVVSNGTPTLEAQLEGPSSQVSRPVKQPPRWPAQGGGGLLARDEAAGRRRSVTGRARIRPPC